MSTETKMIIPMGGQLYEITEKLINEERGAAIVSCLPVASEIPPELEADAIALRTRARDLHATYTALGT